MKRKIIAVDFDGTLYTDDYPDIGDPIWRTINYCKQEKENGAILILWTCRSGQDLVEAIRLCKQVELHFDYVNENAKESMFGYARDSRKIYADEYIDDKAINVRDLPQEPYNGF
jgi:hydroxymethylpyrimidine pyrophosphatase-like HAD family hydrolase